MSRKSLVVLGVAILAALLVSACGTPNQVKQEQVAVINYDEAFKAHPERQRLEKKKIILEDLLQRRKQQERVALEQLRSLDKLRQLTTNSKRSYLSADFNTRMVEMQANENVRLQKLAAKVEAEADKLIADRKKAVEETYQLELFNLRVQLESVKLKPELREQIHLQLVRVKKARESELAKLMAERNAYIETAMKPHIEAMQKRMAAYAEQQQANINNKLAGSAAEQEEKLKKAPDALQRALAIMDKEIDKQRISVDELEKQINKDIVSISTKLAHERGYTVIFKDVKVNLKAADITADVVGQLKKEHDIKK